LITFLLLPVLFATVTPQGNAVQVVHALQTPAPPLPALPVIARIRLDVSQDRVLVVHEIVMARGDYTGGDIDLWASFGPVLPRAIDARLLSVPPSTNAPDPSDTGEPIALDKAAHRPAQAHALLGRALMAGVVLHVREPAFRRAIAASNVMAVRIRQVLPPPAPDAQGGREVVVRLGIESGTPLTVRRIDLSTPEPLGWITSVSAQLCGPNADPYILGFASAPPASQTTLMPIDPPAATRRATDDLCVRYVTRAP
jgi:hypothetical protein